jgi:hypothetical protein
MMRLSASIQNCTAVVTRNESIGRLVYEIITPIIYNVAELAGDLSGVILR